MQVVRLVLVDEPELLSSSSDSDIFPNHLHFHRPYIFPQQSKVLVCSRRSDDLLHGNLPRLRLPPAAIPTSTIALFPRAC